MTELNTKEILLATDRLLRFLLQNIDVIIGDGVVKPSVSEAVEREWQLLSDGLRPLLNTRQNL